MVKRVIERFERASLKNKIFIATTLVILLLSLLVALFTRWLLISSLTDELKQRGIGIANSIAESSRTHILTHNIAALTSLLFDARLGERRSLIGYVFVQDKDGHLLAHTFTHPFPEELTAANRLIGDASESVHLLHTGGLDIYDAAVSIREGIYPVGSVHVGLYKKHIDGLIGKLRTIFIAFLTAVTLLSFLLSHRLALYITRPIAQLIRLSDDLSRGNLDVSLNSDRAVDGASGKTSPGLADVRDEVHLLARSFDNMARHIRDSQVRIRESERKYRSLFASGPNPIFVVDRQTMSIVDANPTAEAVYGYSREDLIGRPLTLLGPFTLGPLAWEGQARMGPPEILNANTKVQYFRKDGSPLFVNVHACPMHHGQWNALIVATTDITEMVEKDNQLIQFSKLKTLGEMSAGIAHELNQPLNAIKMGSEYMDMILEQGNFSPPEEFTAVIQEVSRQVDRATDIIARLRNFGRKSDLNRETVSLNAPVMSVVKILERQMNLQNIDLALDLTEAPLPVTAHPNRIEQVIFNLLTNARDALLQKVETGKEGERRIRIETTRQEDWAVLSVADNGIGIPEEERRRIFEAFYTSKEMGEGMGLGLSISLGIVEDYGGKLDVESTEQEGAIFRLSLPLGRPSSLSPEDAV